jgi:hypothetical protein
MVLSKNSYEGNIECLYDSSNIVASKYVTKDKKLALIFKSGRQYVYSDVTFIDYNKFETSESQGKTFNTIIKKYSYSRADNDVDVSPLLEQINILKEG